MFEYEELIDEKQSGKRRIKICLKKAYNLGEKSLKFESWKKINKRRNRICA